MRLRFGNYPWRDSRLLKAAPSSMYGKANNERSTKLSGSPLIRHSVPAEVGDRTAHAAKKDFAHGDNRAPQMDGTFCKDSNDPSTIRNF